jgi:hypothetical protein
MPIIPRDILRGFASLTIPKRFKNTKALIPNVPNFMAKVYRTMLQKNPKDRVALKWLVKYLNEGAEIKHSDLVGSPFEKYGAKKLMGEPLQSRNFIAWLEEESKRPYTVGYNNHCKKDKGTEPLLISDCNPASSFKSHKSK